MPVHGSRISAKLTPRRSNTEEHKSPNFNLTCNFIHTEALVSEIHRAKTFFFFVNAQSRKRQEKATVQRRENKMKQNKKTGERNWVWHKVGWWGQAAMRTDLSPAEATIINNNFGCSDSPNSFILR